jgi:hypothetical protein
MGVNDVGTAVKRLIRRNVLPSCGQLWEDAAWLGFSMLELGMDVAALGGEVRAARYADDLGAEARAARYADNVARCRARWTAASTAPTAVNPATTCS